MKVKSIITTMEIGENEWGGLRFEEFIWENVSSWKDGETLDTEEE